MSSEKEHAQPAAAEKTDKPAGGGGDNLVGAIGETVKKAIASLQGLAAGSAIKDTAERIKTDVKNTPQRDWIVGAGIALVLGLLYHNLTKNKDESMITFTVIFYAAVITLIAVVVRMRKIHNQYAWSVVLLNVMALIFSWSAGAILVMSAVPPLVNNIREELKKGH